MIMQLNMGMSLRDIAQFHGVTVDEVIRAIRESVRRERAQPTDASRTDK
jgi:hypothetical protein